MLRRFMDWLAAERKLEFRDYDELWHWSVSELDAFWAAIWDYFDVQASEPYERVLGSRAMPGAEWFPGARLSYAEHIFRGKDDTAVAVRHASELRELPDDDLGRAARPDGADRRGAAGARRRARRPGRRIHAERAGDDRGLPRMCVDRRHVVELLARLRRALGGRPLRADRAEGAVRGRRLPLQRQGLRPDGRGRGARGRDAVARAHHRRPVPERRARLPHARQGAAVGAPARARGRCRPGRRARVRAAAVRPPALGPLLVRHDGAAEGDRAQPGRDPARAPEEAQPAPRRPPRRPGLLVHHDRLDDVELPRRRAADPGRDRPLRRQSPGHRDMGVLWDLAEQTGTTCFGTSAAYPRVMHEGGGRALGRPRPERAALGRLDRVAALAGGIPVGVRPRRRGHLAVLDLRRDRRVHRVRRRLRAAAGPPRRAPGARAGRRGPGIRRGGQRADRRGRRAGDHGADAVDAGLLLERPRRRAPARELLRDVSRHLASRRLDRDHRPRHVDHLRPLRLDHQPRRHPHGHERDLPRGARDRRDRRRAGRRRAPGGRRRAGCRCSWSCARAPSSTTR